MEQWDTSKSLVASLNQEGYPDDISDEEEVTQVDDDKDCSEKYSAHHRYFPPVVGKLKSLKEVQDRVSGIMKMFSELNHP